MYVGDLHFPAITYVGILLPCVEHPFLNLPDHDFNFVLLMVEQM